jgi:drug/metabolite transporter (DMT)-like permease
MSGVPPLVDRRLMAIALVLAALLAFTGIDTCAKWLVLAGLPIPEVIFVRYLVHLALVLVFALIAGESVWRSENRSLALLRGGALLFSTAMNFWALSYLPLATTASIFFTSPLWVCLLSIPMLGERVGPRRWLAIGIGFLGILVVTRPLSGTAHWAMGLSMMAAMGGALYVILTRKLAGRDSTASMQFHAALIATLGTAPLALGEWHWPGMASGWIALGLIGIFGWGGHQLLTVAHRFAPATVLAPFVYVQIVYMTASGWIIFGDAPDAWVLVGAGIVVGSGLYIWLRERQIARRETPSAVVEAAL